MSAEIAELHPTAQSRRGRYIDKPLNEITWKDLPFVSDLGRRKGWDRWAVPECGYSDGWKLGEQYALAYLEALIGGKVANDLQGIALAQAEKGMEPRGVVNGFWATLGQASTFIWKGRYTYFNTVADWFEARRVESEAALEEYHRQQAAQRSEHARKAANARWAKARASAPKRRPSRGAGS